MKHNFKLQRSFAAATTLFLLYLLVAIFKVSLDVSDFTFGVITSAYEIILDFLLVDTCRRWIKSQNKQVSVSAILITVAMGALLLADIIYNIELNILNIQGLRGSILEMTYNIPYMIFLILTAVFFSLVCITNSGRERIASWVLSTFLATFIFIIFVPKMNSEHLPWWNYINHIICLTAKSIIVGHTLLILIFGRDVSLRLASAGYLTILSYSLLLEFIEIFGTLSQGLPTEVFWILGQIVLLLGLRQFHRSELLLKRRFKTKNTNLIWDFRSLDSRLMIYGLLLSFAVIVSWNGLQDIWSHSKKMPPAGIALAWFLLLTLILSMFTIYVRAMLVQPMQRLHFALGQASNSGDFTGADIQMSSITELKNISEGILATFERMKDEKLRNENLTNVATQMSHDIRSPLAALRMLTSQVDELPEEVRQMVQSIASRIHLIADTLVKSQTGEHLMSMKIPHQCLAYSVIENVTSEKRLILPKNIVLDIIVLNHAHTAWVGINEESLGRAISNLLNNSIESFLENQKITNCRIVLTLSLVGTSVRITIQDNAGGICEDIENRIREGMKASTKQHGLGLGLSHAKDMLKQCGGTFEILTQFGFGTVVNLIMPSAPMPNWLATSIDLNDITTVVVVDDDQSIHEVWKSRLGSRISIIHCQSPAEAMTLEVLHDPQTLLLVDYEFRGGQSSGLDFITAHVDGPRTYLVTSHFMELSVVSRSQVLAVSIIPKFIAPFMKIEG